MDTNRKKNTDVNRTVDMAKKCTKLSFVVNKYCKVKVDMFWIV